MKITIKADELHRKLASEAVQIQDACNTSGLARRFALVMQELCGSEQSSGTDWRNQHPVACMWIDKMASLARVQGTTTERATDAWVACDRLRIGMDAEWEILP